MNNIMEKFCFSLGCLAVSICCFTIVFFIFEWLEELDFSPWLVAPVVIMFVLVIVGMGAFRGIFSPWEVDLDDDD